MKTSHRREKFISALLLTADGYTVQVWRRDGLWIGGWDRTSLAKLLRKHFPGSRRANKKIALAGDGATPKEK